jgi:hypothetical protein
MDDILAGRRNTLARDPGVVLTYSYRRQRFLKGAIKIIDIDYTAGIQT